MSISGRRRDEKRYNAQEVFTGASFEYSPYVQPGDTPVVDVYDATLNANRRNARKVYYDSISTVNPMDVVAQEAGLVFTGKKPSKRGGVRLGVDPTAALPAVSRSYIQRRKKDSPNYNEFAQEGGADIWGLIEPTGVGPLGHKMRGIELKSQSLESAADIAHLDANGGTAEPVKLSYRLPRDTNAKAIGLRPAAPVTSEEIRVMLRNSQREGTMQIIQIYATGRTVGNIVCALTIGEPSKDPSVFFAANRSRLKRDAIQGGGGGDQPE